VRLPCRSAIAVRVHRALDTPLEIVVPAAGLVGAPLWLRLAWRSARAVCYAASVVGAVLVLRLARPPAPARPRHAAAPGV